MKDLSLIFNINLKLVYFNFLFDFVKLLFFSIQNEFKLRQKPSLFKIKFDFTKYELQSL